MLDLAIIIPELAKYGGAERYVVECVQRWQHLHRITIYATKFDQAFLEEHGITAGVTRMNLSPYFEGEHAMLLNALLLPKVWEGQIGKHDLYHTHLWPTHLIDLHPSVWFPHEPLRSIYDLRHNQSIEGFAAGDKTKFDIHVYPKYNYDNIEEDLHESYLRCMELFDKLGKPDRIVANSRYTARYLSGVYGQEVTDVVYPGVNVDDFMHLQSSEDIVLTIAQLWPHKRIRLVIESMRYVDGVQLYIVGSGPEKAKLMLMAEKLGLSDRVFILDGLSDLEVQILFSRCLAVVFVPIKEPFGIVALEALAAGRPLIAVNEGGFTEIIDESCSFLVPPRPAAIAEKIRFLKENRQVARAMGEEGITKARNYTWDATASQLLTIVEDVHRQWSTHRIAAKADRIDREQEGLFGIQYYCWYGEGLGSLHWNDNQEFGAVTDMPTIGYYASAHGSTVVEHLQLLEKTGFDFLILNLHIDSDGINRYELATIKNIFEIAQTVRSPLRFAVQLCLFECEPESIEDVMKRVSAFAEKEHYLYFREKPVLFVFWTGSLDRDVNRIKIIDQHTHGFIRIASSLRLYPGANEYRRTFGLFHGFSLFSPLELSGRESWEKIWQDAYDSSEAGGLGLRIVTISPGYDDSHLEGVQRKSNVHRRIPREDGQTWKRMADFALKQEKKPHIFIVSTFNEYHENTHIEPSVQHGSRYLEMAKGFIAEARSKWHDR